jgi:hypothetical protein
MLSLSLFFLIIIITSFSIFIFYIYKFHNTWHSSYNLKQITYKDATTFDVKNSVLNSAKLNNI